MAEGPPLSALPPPQCCRKGPGPVLSCSLHWFVATSHAAAMGFPACLQLNITGALIRVVKANKAGCTARHLLVWVVAGRWRCCLLSQGSQSHTCVVACAGLHCALQELDEAARRRLPKQLYIPLPCAEARRAMIFRQLGPGGKVSAALSPTGEDS